MANDESVVFTRLASASKDDITAEAIRLKLIGVEGNFDVGGHSTFQYSTHTHTQILEYSCIHRKCTMYI